MNVRILGSGGSFGVPLIGNRFGICDKNNPKNYRTRPSILLNYKGKNILIDTGPDIRQQLLDAKCDKINAILYTHKHADHIHGINDLRAVSLLMKSKIPAWGSKETNKHLKNTFLYIFEKTEFYEAILELNEIQESFFIDDVKVNTFQHNHGFIDSTTYRIDKFAYTTDIKKFYDGTLEKLKGIDKWIISCLKMEPHPSHASFEEIIEFVNYIKPKKTFLTHLTGLMDYETLLKKCPEYVEPAYDGLEFEV